MVVGSSPTPGASARAPDRRSSGRGRRASVALGAASELETVAALRRAGYHVSIPVLDGGSPYDCIIDDGRSLLRVQIKTGYIARGSVWWACRSTSYHRRGGTVRDYVGVADLFAVWVPETGQCYLVPVAGCGRHESALRLAPARNGQRKRVRLAADYEVPTGPAPHPPRADDPTTD